MVEHQITLVRRGPAPPLRGLVAGLVGISERAPGLVQRRQPAGSLVPLVISVSAPLHVDHLSDATGAGRGYGSFVAGFSPGHASTSFIGRQDCVQVYLYPLGVSRVLGLPAEQVSRRVTPLDELLPGIGLLAEQLADRNSWAERLALVQAQVQQWASRDDAGTPGWVVWLWNRMSASGGRVRIADLVAETGWSHRHVTTTFTAYAGLSPKQAADIVRFEQASADLGRLSLAELATKHGYADQSHFTRAVTRYAGESPTQLLAARRPTPATALGLELST
ncbi:helix-turn-helix domain-containing protein [Propionibacteriaceae bacterium G1746]